MTIDSSALQQRFISIRENRMFETFVIAVIIISALVIGAKTYAINAQVDLLFKVLDITITLFFLTEIIIRMIADHSLKKFFSKGWNIFDFVIVTASLVPIDESEMALLGRLLRIFRVLRLVSIIPELRVLLNAFHSHSPHGLCVVADVHLLLYLCRHGQHLLQQDQSRAVGEHHHLHADTVPCSNL